MKQEDSTLTIYGGKINRLERCLNWIVENCNEDQLEEVEKVISQHDFLLTFPDTGMMRTTHEYTGRRDSIISHVPSNREQAQEINIEEEIQKRKQIVNGFITEIEELKEYR